MNRNQHPLLNYPKNKNQREKREKKNEKEFETRIKAGMTDIVIKIQVELENTERQILQL